MINQAFAFRDREQALRFVDEHETFWTNIVGTRGFTGKRAVNSLTHFNRLFEVDSDEESSDEEDQLDQTCLDQLEEQQDVS
jgi:hypothetical protein